MHSFLTWLNEYSYIANWIQTITIFSILYELYKYIKNKKSKIDEEKRLVKVNNKNNKVKWNLQIDLNKNYIKLKNDSGKNVKDTIKLYKIIYVDDDYKKEVTSLIKYPAPFRNMVINNTNAIFKYKFNHNIMQNTFDHCCHLGSIYHYINYEYIRNSLPSNMRHHKIKYTYDFGMPQKIVMCFRGEKYPRFYRKLVFKKKSNKYKEDSYILDK